MDIKKSLAKAYYYGHLKSLAKAQQQQYYKHNTKKREYQCLFLFGIK